jgi:hypothetical protein
MPVINGLNMNFEDDSMVTARIAKEYPILPENDFELQIVNICHELAETLIKKNRDYGDSFSKLYQEFGDLSVIIRLSDKLERYKNLVDKDNLVKDESKEDTLKDTAGYSILTMAMKRMKK